MPLTFLRKIQFWPRWIIAAIFLVVGFGAGWVFYYGFTNKHPVPIPIIKAVRQTESGYELINPLLFYDQPDSVVSAQYEPLKKQLVSFINNQISAKKATKISLYFRGMTINADDKYDPASLMKVPTMIAILQYAQTHPETLSKQLLYDGSFDDNAIQVIKPSKQLTPNTFYTIDELLSRMIIYSDNNAAHLLLHYLPLDMHYKVFTDLGLSTPPESFTIDNFDYIGVKSYASFFRVLYNATYLSRDMSEKAMQLLVQTDFTRGLEAGIPKDTKIAHKFGEVTVYNQLHVPLAVELHDCGFIYYGSQPYLLCVMTSGSDFADSENILKNISSMAYQYMDKKTVTPF